MKKRLWKKKKKKTPQESLSTHNPYTLPDEKRIRHLVSLPTVCVNQRVQHWVDAYRQPCYHIQFKLIYIHKDPNLYRSTKNRHRQPQKRKREEEKHVDFKLFTFHFRCSVPVWVFFVAGIRLSYHPHEVEDADPTEDNVQVLVLMKIYLFVSFNIFSTRGVIKVRLLKTIAIAT